MVKLTKLELQILLLNLLHVAQIDRYDLALVGRGV